MTPFPPLLDQNKDCCTCCFAFGPTNTLALGSGHHAQDTRAREEQQECKTAACAEDVADHADNHAEDDRHRHLSNAKDSIPRPCDFAS